MNSSDITRRDLTWASQIRDGNRDAFSKLFYTYYAPLCDYASQYVSEQELVEDIVQEVFIRIWELQEQWEPRISPRSYLYKSVYHQVINEFRKKRFHLSLDEFHNEFVVPDTQNPFSLCQEQQLSSAFQKAVETLPRKRREIILLRLVHELSYKEISSILGISVSTVDTQIRRGLSTLRVHLKDFATV